MIIETVAINAISHDNCVKNGGRAFDWITAVALLVIGILGACKILSLNPAISYSFLGAGVVYTLVMIIRSSLDLNNICKNKHH